MQRCSKVKELDKIDFISLLCLEYKKLDFPKPDEENNNEDNLTEDGEPIQYIYYNGNI